MVLECRALKKDIAMFVQKQLVYKFDLMQMSGMLHQLEKPPGDHAFFRRDAMACLRLDEAQLAGRIERSSGEKINR